MKIRFKENGDDKEIEVNRIIIEDKDGNLFRVKQDYESGLKILGDSLDGKMCVEQHTSNQISVLMR